MDLLLDFNVVFDEEPQPDVADMFPGAGVGRSLDGPIQISEYCMEQINRQVFACREAQRKWGERNKQVTTEI
jgi:hypothetical protein